MRTTIDLPEDLLRQAKAYAALNGTSLKELVSRCLRQGLQQDIQSTASTRQRSPIPIARRATGVPIPAMSNREINELLEAEEIERVAKT